MPTEGAPPRAYGPVVRPATPAMLKVVSHDGNPRLTHAPNNRLHILDVLRALWAIQQNVMPMRGIEVLDGFEFKPFGFDVRLNFTNSSSVQS